MNDTIKMFIAGEEVVSNSDFTINEEMLSASSTILNNCYPASWEIDKDYVSNFYFPKDYSKFLLGEGEFLHGLNEYAILTESGSNPFYTTNVEKEWNSLNVYGNTYQATRSGMNLFDYTQTYSAPTHSTVDDEGWITSSYDNTNGTAAVNCNYFSKIPTGVTIEANKTYTIFLEVKSVTYGSNSDYIRITNNNANYISSTTLSSIALKDLAANTTYRVELTTKADLSGVTGLLRTYIAVASGSNVTLVYRFSVLKGSVSLDDFTYEPFGVMPSPEFPSELVSVGYENYFDGTDVNYTYNGITWQYNNDTSITISGKATATSTRSSTYDLNIPKGQYTISINHVLPFSLKFRMSNGVNTVYATLPKNSLSLLYNLQYDMTTMRIYIDTDIAIDDEINETIFIQFVEGVEKSYIPYGKYGIEIINKGKNLFDEIFRQGARNNTTATNRIYSLNNFKIQQGRTYTISTNLDTTVFRYAVNISQLPYPNSIAMDYDSGWKTTSSFTFTANTTGYFGIPISRINGANLTPSDIAGKWFMLEENSQATTYEPYKSNSQLYILDEPLRAIGDYKDRLFIQNGVLYVERNIKSVILNGSESWTLSQTSNVFYMAFAETNFIINNNIPKSNYFIGTGNVGSASAMGNKQMNTIALSSANTANVRIYIKTNVVSTKDSLIQWLSNNNTEVQYVLEEPTTTPIGYVNIPNAYEGQNTTYLYTGLTTTMDVLYYWKNFNVLFAGVVKNTGDISLNPRYPHYCNLQILDYKTFLSESNTLDFVIANKTIREAITMVVNAVSGYGFVLGEININSANDIIGAYSTLNKTAYDVLQYLANISGSRWRARYVDSSTMAIDFYDPNTLPQGANIEYTQQYWEDNNIVDLTFNYGTRDYRNKQILLSDEVYANIDYNETLISNGYSNTFTLQNNVGNIISIIVNNQEKTFVTTNDKQMGIDADFYYSPSKNTLESNIIYPAGTMIYLTYQPLVKGRQIVYNSSEVERISSQTDTEGVIARYESRNDILSSDELEKIAQTYIEYKGKAEVILTLRTQNKDLYNVGEVVYFDAPIDDLKQNYMVKTKKINYIVINSILSLFYEYELTSSFNSEKAINYFDNQRNKASGNISSGDSITRNIDIETDVNIIWNNGTISSASITINGDNELNSTLNSPFIE